MYRYAQDDRLPFRFPLEDAKSYLDGEPATFCTAGRNRLDDPYDYHAAEDYFQPAGTPVYAMADGKVSFSGQKGGYGWLIIIDHPQYNIYSLYGHLSPSSWYVKPGTVSKGDLIGYLGDSHENGGSREQPLEPHLHLGIRAGQRGDYSAKGEWRWMAGWIRLCPGDIGWLRPSEVIGGQSIPAAGYSKPKVDFLTLWGVETLFGLLYLSSGIGVVIYATRKDRPWLAILAGAVMLIAGSIFYKEGWKISPVLLTLSFVLFFSGIKRLAFRKQ